MIVLLIVYYKFMLNTKRFAYHRKMLYPEMSEQYCQTLNLDDTQLQQLAGFYYYEPINF